MINLLVLLGAYDARNKSESSRSFSLISNLSIHEDYSPNSPRNDADLAIITLRSKITISRYIIPACLWKSPDSPTAETGKIAGWRHSTANSFPIQLTAKLQTNEDCFLANYSLADISSNRTKCAWPIEKNKACVKVQGHGLFFKSGDLFYLHGIRASHPQQREVCESTEGAIYTDVLKFSSWIIDLVSSEDLFPTRFSGQNNWKPEITFPDENSCKDPNGVVGSCVLVQDCPQLSSSPRVNPETLNKLNCGYEGITPRVCCTSNSPPTDWLEQLKKKLPQSPYCGIYAEDRLSDGGRVQLGDLGWTFGLVSSQGEVRCVGSLMNNRYLLTGKFENCDSGNSDFKLFSAAHCVKREDSSWQLEYARVGDWNLKTDPDCIFDDFGKACASTDDYRISDVLVHPQYNSRLSKHDFNIAMLRLEKKVEFDGYVAPICLPLDASLWNKEFKPKKQFQITGRNIVQAFID